jgi:hypothetical protein
MSIFKVIVILSIFSLCQQAFAGDIGHGTIKGVKVYDFSNSKVTKIYFNDDVTRKIEVDCNGVANITHSAHDEATSQKMLSVALSAYMAGKKVRIYSQASGSCEVGLISVQETYF